MNIPSSSSSGNKPGSWARTLFAGGTAPGGNSALLGSSQLSSSEQDAMDAMLPESPISSYNQHATNAVLNLLNIHVCRAVIIACLRLICLANRFDTRVLLEFLLVVET
jgi:hypothetical protein